MGWLKRRAGASDGRRLDMIGELERLGRRLAAFSVLIPVLLFGGLGLGKHTARALALPEDAPVRARIDGAARIQLDALSREMHRLRRRGDDAERSIAIYREHVEPVEAALRRRGIPEATARQVAWPLVEYAYREALDPTIVLSVLLIESRGIPDATSSVGARGLMQVMPAWTGHWRECGRDLYDIESNLCYGTRILAWYLDRFGGDLRRALLGYNGCVRGTNTPNCHTYPDKVLRIRRQVEADMRGARAAPLPAAP